MMDDASPATNTPYLRDKRVQPKVISARTGSRNDTTSMGTTGSIANPRPASSPTEAEAVAGRLPAMFCGRRPVCGTLRKRSMLNVTSPRYPLAMRRKMRVSADLPGDTSHPVDFLHPLLGAGGEARERQCARWEGDAREVLPAPGRSQSELDGRTELVNRPIASPPAAESEAPPPINAP